MIKLLSKDPAKKGWTADSTTPTTKPRQKKIVVPLLVILLLACAGGLGYTYYKYQNTQKELKKLASVEGRKEIEKKEVSDLLAKVKKHMVIPDNEEPVVATITDKDALAKEQPFYANAHNGDRVIAYMTARKAIIYDPIHDVIVNAGPIYIDNQAQDKKLDTPAQGTPATNTPAQ